MLLDITDLKRSFRSPQGEETPIVDIPRFNVERARELALRGGSGSGKTTFLHLVSGLLRPDSGRILLDGLEITGLSEAAMDRHRARSLGYIFQSFHLLAGYTALENVELAMSFAGGVDRGRARQLLERVGLEDREDYLPGQLSVGQRQRVAVARAVANRPALVLADEPTGNLDRRMGGQVMELIREVCRESEAALVVVSHDPEILAGFESVLEFSELNRAVAA